MTKLKVYRQIKKNSKLVATLRTKDYRYKTERWKHGNILYTVVIRITPCLDKVSAIYGRVLN